MSELWYGPPEPDEPGGFDEPAEQKAWRERRAKQVCARCRFTKFCLAAELALPQVHQWGVRGGMSAAERRPADPRAPACGRGGGGMSLAIFGLVLLGAVLGLSWKNHRAGVAALVAVMLGLTIGASDGALAEPATALVDAIRSALDSLGDSLFGGGA